jgi:SAM-dependent methyltransferase
MDVIEQEQLTFQEAKQHWYYQSKYGAMVNWIRRTDLSFDLARVGDFGCGAGLFLSLLVDGGIFPRENLLGVDLAYRKDSLLPNSKVRVVPSLEGQGLFDLFLLMDVLEHIEDDQGALHLVSEHCRPGGYLFVTVPALKWLWSGHDIFLGHKRRYSVGSLNRLFAAQSDLEVIGIHYFYASILPLVVPFRLFKNRDQNPSSSDMRPVGNAANVFLKSLLSFESSIMSRNQVAGLTVMALCRKK